MTASTLNAHPAAPTNIAPNAYESGYDSQPKNVPLLEREPVLHEHLRCCFCDIEFIETWRWRGDDPVVSPTRWQRDAKTMGTIHAMCAIRRMVEHTGG